jgi:hypothetical protein
VQDLPDEKDSGFGIEPVEEYACGVYHRLRLRHGCDTRY